MNDRNLMKYGKIEKECVEIEKGIKEKEDIKLIGL